MVGGGPRPRVPRTREATLPPQLSSSLFLPDRPGLSKASRGHCPPWGPADARLRHDGDHLHPKEDAGGGGAEGGHRPAADHAGLAPVGGLGASRVLSISSTLECISSVKQSPDELRRVSQPFTNERMFLRFSQSHPGPRAPKAQGWPPVRSGRESSC